MLREIEGLRQDEPGLQRRWFHDEYFDLFVWQKPDGGLAAFELCYGDHADERALVWKEDGGLYHDGPLGMDEDGRIAARFDSAGAALPAEVRAAVDARIAEYAAARDRIQARRGRFRRADWQQRREKR